MDIDGQVLALRGCYRTEIKRVYDVKFQMRLKSVMFFNLDYYDRLLHAVEKLSSIIEGAVTDCNPKRILRYLIILRSTIDDLIAQTDKDYNKLWDNKLTH